MTKLIVENTNFEGLKVINGAPITDNRGYLSRLFCSNYLLDYGWNKPIAQINYTNTKKIGIVRGMHFQRPPYSEIKIVNCLKGKILDVVVDLRSKSKTFLKYFAIELEEGKYKSLLIPEGFAHGFQALASNVELLYFHSCHYQPKAEDGINPRDPTINIAWPIKNIIISEKDEKRKFIDINFQGI
jgi:dTDP-4-dehydrorhamnose 3,5-epimerase